MEIAEIALWPPCRVAVAWSELFQFTWTWLDFNIKFVVLYDGPKQLELEILEYSPTNSIIIYMICEIVWENCVRMCLVTAYECNFGVGLCGDKKNSCTEEMIGTFYILYY